MLGYIVEFLNDKEISQDLVKFFLNHTKKMEVAKGSILTDFEEVEDNLYFIAKGGLRTYGFRGKREVSLEIQYENQFVTLVESFYERTPSLLRLETIEDSSLLYLTYEDYINGLKEFPQLNAMIREHLHNYVAKRIHREFQLLMYDTDTRYRDFLAERPDLIGRTPKYMIASYLDITPETYSRVQKRNDKSN